MGIILSIIGGVKSGNEYGETGRYTPQTLTKVGLGLFIASFVAILAIAAILSPSISHAEPGEKVILHAVAASMPLLLVRLIYSAVGDYRLSAEFSSLSGSASILFWMALMEEVWIVMLYESVGLTLQKAGEQAVATGCVIGYPQSEFEKNDEETQGQELGTIDAV